MRFASTRTLLTTIAAACGVALFAHSSAHAATPTIVNAGFENGTSGWTEVEPVGTSITAHSGSTSAKVSSGGQIKQTISGLSAGTPYAVTAWVRGNARVGVRNFGGATNSKLVVASDWTKTTIKFATGPSNTSAEVYASWASGGDARVDDFTLARLDPSTVLELTPTASRVKASTSNTNTPDRVVDGSLSTRWSGYGDGAWLRMDLGAQRRVSHVKVAIYDGAARRAKFDLQVSDDGSTWSTVWSGSSSGTTTGRQTYDFPDVAARYVRYRGHGFTSDGTRSMWNSVTEMEIFGAVSTDGVAEEETTAQAPSDVLDLRNWYLTLPVNATTEIEQPELDGFVSSPWFVVFGNGDGVRFRAHTSGSTTTGSEYPRSELREMKSDGTVKAAWTNTSGRHHMFVEQAITAVPRGKQDIVAGQIHDGSEGVIFIRYEHPGKLMVKTDTRVITVLDADYKLGERFTIDMVAENGKIKIYYNGSSTPAYTYTTSRTGCYFKAGAYTQSNCETEAAEGETCGTSNYGEVVIYDLQVWHE
jgi:hypothetical protein